MPTIGLGLPPGGVKRAAFVTTFGGVELKTEIMPEEWGGRRVHAPLVFVYGTLRKGGCNDINRLVPPPVLCGRSSVHGRLYDLGAYPGLLLASGPEEDGIAARGEVYAIEPALERQLDLIEGIQGRLDDEYFRRQVLVKVDGQPCGCLIYEINPEYVRDRPLINHGDWIKHVGVVAT